MKAKTIVIKSEINAKTYSLRLYSFCYNLVINSAILNETYFLFEEKFCRIEERVVMSCQKRVATHIMQC